MPPEPGSGDAPPGYLETMAPVASTRSLTRPGVTAPRAPVKVLFVMGPPRSGSTLLDMLLGELDGFFSTGELRYLWERGVLAGRRCGCGSLVTDCPVWSAVLDDVDARLGPTDPAAVVEQQRAVRLRNMPRLRRLRRTGGRTWPAMHSYVRLLGALYASIADVTGARVIVDSTKRPPDAALLPLVPNIDPYYVHLVRDPRAVAYSWSRRKQELDRGTDSQMRTWTTWKSAATWTAVNMAAASIGRDLPGRSVVIRYEDLIGDPAAVLPDLLAHVGESKVPLMQIGNGEAHVGTNHTVSGNPTRFAPGTVRLRLDDEWLRRQSTDTRALVTAMTAPLLPRYGYRLWPTARNANGRRDDAL